MEDRRGEGSYLTLKAGDLFIALNEVGFIVGIYNATKEESYLPSGRSAPLLSVWEGERKLEPSHLKYDKEKGMLRLGYGEGNIEAQIRVDVKPTHLRFQLASLREASPSRIDWGPFPTTIAKTIGETIGVVRGEEFAIGIQALNMQTIAGAEKTDFGSQLYAYAVEKEGGVRDSAIAIFGCPQEVVLETIGEIEIAEGLPHPLLDGVWAKLSPSATLSYLVTDFSEANFPEALELCRRLGFKYIYHPGPFESWGHFILDRRRFPEGDESLRRCVEEARKVGIKVGLHTLTAFITPNDPYVSPKPDPRLGELGSSRLVEDIDEKATEIPVADKEAFLKNQKWGWHEKFALIGEEIIKYEEVSDSNPPRLIGCVRGMFGTMVASHKAGEEVRRLATHAYGTFYPGIANGMMEEMTKRIVELFNYCGLQQISFDGLEGLWDYECESPYAAHRFVKRCYDGWKEEVINDASGLLHYLWHIHTRMNWGEPWGKPMREGMAEYRLKNQDYFDRNLLPHMMGWFEFRPASPQLEATTLDEIEWMLSKCAACDAGFALVTSPEIFKTHGQGETVIKVIREWEEARLKGAFSKEQKERMRELKSDWHLERIGKNRWLLFPIDFSPLFYYPSEENKFQKVIWQIDNDFGEQPLRFILRVLPEGGQDVANPRFEVDGKAISFTLQLKPTQYLVHEGDGIASVYDWNWNLLYEVKGEGEVPLISEGKRAILFSCDVSNPTSAALWVKFKMVGSPEEVALQSK